MFEGYSRWFLAHGLPREFQNHHDGDQRNREGQGGCSFFFHVLYRWCMPNWILWLSDKYNNEIGSLKCKGIFREWTLSQTIFKRTTYNIYIFFIFPIWTDQMCEVLAWLWFDNHCWQSWSDECWWNHQWRFHHQRIWTRRRSSKEQFVFISTYSMLPMKCISCWWKNIKIALYFIANDSFKWDSKIMLKSSKTSIE